MAGGGKRPGAGRPKGVPNKATAEVKAIAGQYTAEAVEILIGIARTSESDPARVAAVKEILDRGHGKATQHIDATMDVTLNDVARAAAAIRRRSRHAGESAGNVGDGPG